MEWVAPYPKNFNPRGPDGLWREIHPEIKDGMIFRMAADLMRVRPEYPRGGTAWLDFFMEEIEGIVQGAERPVDQTIRDRILHLSPDQRRKGAMPGVLVDTRVNARGNLVAVISPRRIDKDGEDVEADEWKWDPFQPGSPDPRRRPRNEIFFISKIAEESRCGVIADKHGDLVLNAVLTSYWLTINRLSRVFRIHFKSYLAGLSSRQIWNDGSGYWPLEALELVFAEDLAPGYRGLE